MKKLLFLMFAVYLTFVSSLNSVDAQNSKKSIATSSPISVLNGGWQRIVVETDGKMESNYHVPQFRVCHDGFYSGLGQDSAGAWKVTYAGTYEISNNLWKEKILYCSNPDLIGTIHWQEFTMKGDTVILKYFNKLINPKGEDVTATQRSNREAIWVRAKQ
jgi:hypothetical protein